MPTPEIVPEMMTDCPVCMEPLFDKEGIIIGDKEVAKIMCCHLVHDDCLRQAAQALNSDGSLFGIGGLGEPRAGCPVCDQPVTMWFCFKEAADFPIFWMKRILDCVEKFGPQDGPVPVKKVSEMLEADPTLTRAQKKAIRQSPRKLDVGFGGALESGKGRCVYEEVDGGISQGGYMKMCWKDYVWRWDTINDTLWLHKWDESHVGEATTSSLEMATTDREDEDEQVRKHICTAWWEKSSIQFLLAVILAIFFLIWFE